MPPPQLSRGPGHIPARRQQPCRIDSMDWPWVTEHMHQASSDTWKHAQLPIPSTLFVGDPCEGLLYSKGGCDAAARGRDLPHEGRNQIAWQPKFASEQATFFGALDDARKGSAGIAGGLWLLTCTLCTGDWQCYSCRSSIQTLSRLILEYPKRGPNWGYDTKESIK